MLPHQTVSEKWRLHRAGRDRCWAWTNKRAAVSRTVARQLLCRHSRERRTPRVAVYSPESASFTFVFSTGEALKVATCRAEMVISSPVNGLRPMRGFL